MEIQAKERLTGAVIIVALVVLLVPELLSGPHRGAARPGTADEVTPLRSVTLRLDEEPHPAAAGSEASAASTSVAALQASSARAVPARAPSPESAADAPPAAAAEAESAPAAAPVRSAPPARATVEPATAKRAAAHARDEWSVQLGSFASHDNAERLARELQRQGFTARISVGEGRGRKWYRVRAGPARDRAAAQALARRLKAAGHAGSVVAAF
ncbi:MAG TPA: SPOR domain-containing protein [Steroidobacteraceae bacterium]|nr:SPOR domain-containing protein [Steroidobacteraceae bacterium]